MGENLSNSEKGILKFRPRARLLNLLGHELISNEAIAINELVKNSYDADAKEVRVILTDVTDRKKGRIEIRDDGHGMTLEIMEKAWMEPARDNKIGTGGKRERTKRFNRLPLGEKGVGRFSADKLGLRLEIVSRFCEFNPRTKEAIHLSPEEVVVVIEGRKFVETAYLDEIECQWYKRIPKEFDQDGHGTLLRISELRTDWSCELVEKVYLSLARLSSPLSGAQDFCLFFESSEFKEFAERIENPLLKNAPYFLDGKVNENGIMTYTLIGPEETIKEATLDLRRETERFHIKQGKDISFRKPACGPFRFRLYAFERDRQYWKKYSMDKTKLELLNDLCGVSIYRDGFRVFPYGERGNDWLNFDRRRVLNPGKVLGNDRVIGYVEISQKLNPHLRDKTNREGLIEEGIAFADLRDLAVEASDFLGLYRAMRSPHKKRSKARVEEAKDDIETGSRVVGQTSLRAMTNLEQADSGIREGRAEEAKSAIGEAKAEVEKSQEATRQIDEGKRKLLEELAVSEEQIDNLISLSGIGMTAERMTHEFSKAVRNATEQLQKSVGILSRDRKTNSEVIRNLELAINQLGIVTIGLQQMEPLYYSRRRSTEMLDVGEVARSMESFYTNTIIDLDVKVHVADESKLYLEMNKGHLMQVFNNLFDNALYWLKYKPAKDRREITIKIDGRNRTVTFADNGQGVDEKVRYHLFEPFISTKADGRGLGLYIVQDILQNYKAEIELLTEGKLLEGANFKISFPEE